jgi:uncharacterized protein (TIRG00374 family)
MKSKKFIIIFGTLLSIILLIVVFSRLDWQAFFAAFFSLRLLPVLLAAGVIIMIIALRSLRWNLVAHRPIAQFKHFWQAANIGYLGNMIYPLRAGEVLRIAAIHHFASLVLGRAITSSVIDRMLDMMIVGIFTMFVLWIHAQKVDPNLGKGVIGVFILATVVLVLLMIFADFLYSQVQGWKVQKQWLVLLQEFFLHALESVKTFRQTHHWIIVLLLTVFAFGLDYFWMWQIMTAFGWDLPFEAAITVGVFILLGISLPAAPGYIGIYQVACVLALGLYDIDESVAVAYSIVLQMVTFTVIGVQGMLVTAYCGFNLSREREQIHIPS